MLHEVPDQARFLGELAKTLKSGGRPLLCEPKVHVSAKAFEESLGLAQQLGLRVESRPAIRISRAALLAR